MSSASKAIPQLSLLAQFDDFCRQSAVDDNEETLRTFLEFVRNQEACRQQWEAADTCVNRLAEENRSLVLANSELQEKLRHARAVLEKEVEKRYRCEARVEALQLQLDQLRRCVFSRGFRNREHHMVRVLKNILGHHDDSFASTPADKSSTANKSVQSTLLSPNSGPSLLSGDGGGVASREASREEQGDGSQWNLRVQSLPGTPASGTGTRHPSCVRPVPAERSSLGSVSAGAGPAFAGPVPAGPAPAGAIYHGLGLGGSVPAGSGSVGFCFTRSAPAGDASVEHGLTGPVLAGPACAGPVSNGLGFARPAPAGYVPNGLGFAGPVSAGFVSNGYGFAGPVPAGFVSNGHGFAKPFPAGAFAGGLGFAAPVPVGLGLAEAVPAPCSSKGAPAGPDSAGLGSGRASAVQSSSAGLGFGPPQPARPASTGQSSAGPAFSPAKVHFELSSPQKSGGNSHPAASFRATSGRVGEVFATTMTVVAGEPSYVATVTSQVDGSISMLSSRQTQQSFDQPAFSPQRLQKPVPNMLDESQVEQESGFISRLVECAELRRSTSTPLHMSPPLPQQAHTFMRRPAVTSEACAACGRRIRFYKASLRCGTCRLVCHPGCQSMVPVPCKPGAPVEQARVISEASTVGGSGKGGTAMSDYAPSKPPLVPPLVAYCIQEVERRCTIEKGPLYGSAVAAEEVDSLLGRLLNRQSLLSLDSYSLPVVCGALVTFLASLRETVVTKAAWPLLAKATEEVDSEKRQRKILDAVLQLPAPNRMTLSALLAHLHHVSATSLGGDGRSLDELVTVFAPLVVGCSENDPSAEVQKRDKPLQELIMHCLLSVPEMYWTDSAAVVGNEAEERNCQLRPGVDDHFVASLKEGIKNRLR